MVVESVRKVGDVVVERESVRRGSVSVRKVRDVVVERVSVRERDVVVEKESVRRESVSVRRERDVVVERRKDARVIAARSNLKPNVWLV